jgi:DNA integrity scanning protein DisA with diadenylate cyclase activity
MNLVLNKSSQITQNKYMVGGATPVEMNVARGTQSRLIESLFNSILVKLAKQGKTISVHDENKFRILLQDMSTLEENLTKALQSLDRYTSTLARGIEDKSDGPVRIDNLESFVRENSKTVNRLIKRNIVAFTYLNTLNNSVPFLFIR